MCVVSNVQPSDSLHVYNEMYREAALHCHCRDAEPATSPPPPPPPSSSPSRKRPSSHPQTLLAQ